MASPQSPPPPPPSMGSSPPGPPPGAPLPPPPTASGNTSSITSANYFFGFVVTFVVLLLLFVGCGIGSWRRFRLIGTAWDERLHDMEASPFSTRRRYRRRLVRPVLSEMWTHPQAVTHLAPVAPSSKAKWGGIQPVSVTFVWSRSTLSAYARRSNAPTALQTPTSGRGNGGSVHGVVTTLRSFVLPRRPRCDRQPKPPSVLRPPPEAMQVAVMIAMPSPPSQASHSLADKGKWVGHPRMGEYQIGVVRIPWPSGEGP